MHIKGVNKYDKGIVYDLKKCVTQNQLKVNFQH